MRGINQRDNQTSVSVSNADNRDVFDEQLQKFKKEAQRLRKFNNEHIVRVHDLFEENGTAYYVMDFIDGENLSERLKRTQTPLTEAEVSALLPQMLDALDAVHQAGMLHLDLKPGNIMVDSNQQVRVIDFGASKQQGGHGGTTMSTSISYTQGYAPREQMEQNRQKFGSWTDIYALGATLYNLLTNEHPPMPSDIDEDHTADKQRALSFPSSISPKMRRLVVGMMATNRDNRPQNIAAVRSLLEEKPAVKVADESTVISTNPQDEETVIATPKTPAPKPKPQAEASFTPTPQAAPVQQKPQPPVESPSFFTRYKIPIIGVAAAFSLVLLIGLMLPGSKAPESSASEDNTQAAASEVSEMTFTHETGECVYSGKVDTKGKPDGKGVATFYSANGQKERIYDGNFSHGKFEGEGSFEWIGGQKFKGTFHDNYFSDGRLTMPDGTYYEGTFHVVESNGERTADVYNGTWYTANGTADAKVVNGKEQ